MLEFVKQIFWSFCYYSFLVLFLVGTVVINMLALVAVPLTSKSRARSVLRWASYHLFNFYVTLMESSGALITNRDILSRINSFNGGLLIVANHPSMVDAIILFSRIRGLVCVFKSSLNSSLWIGRAAKTIGYLSNDGGLDMIRELSEALAKGEKVLLFPEGSRTVSEFVDKFNAGYALAALRSNVPVQVIRIQSDSPILSKKQSKFNTTRFPCKFMFELGPVINPGRHNQVRTLNREVEQWFRQCADQEEHAIIRFIPEIEKRTDYNDSTTFSFTVPPDPFYCRGHMPDAPVVPGYVQMIWLRELLEEMTNRKCLHLKHFRWKFLKPVLPGDTLSVTISLSPNRNKVMIERKDERVTQGLFTLVLENTV